jgi:hypothetical protein
MKNKTVEYLVDKIVQLRINEFKLEDKNRKLESEKRASENILSNYKKEIANLRIALSLAIDNQETNTKEQTQPEVIITDRDDK